MSIPADCSCVRIALWVCFLSTMQWCVVVSGNHGAVIKSCKFRSSISHPCCMPPPHLNFPPSPTGICVSSVIILLMSCVFCSTMIMFSSLQDGWSSLMVASQNGHHEVVKVLLSDGAKIDLQDEVSSTSSSQGPALN